MLFACNKLVNNVILHVIVSSPILLFIDSAGAIAVHEEELNSSRFCHSRFDHYLILGGPLSTVPENIGS